MKNFFIVSSFNFIFYRKFIMKKIVLGFFVILFTILSIFFLIETVLKITAYYKPCSNYDITFLAKSRGFSLENAFYEPNSSVHHCNIDFNYTYTIDNTGLRYSSQAPSHTISIGDSFTFGFGVDDDKSYSFLINSKNAGLWGNSFDVQYMSFLRNIELFQPRNIVWTVYPPHLISMTQSSWSKNCPGDFQIPVDNFGIGIFIFKFFDLQFIKNSSTYKFLIQKFGYFSIQLIDNKILFYRNCYETKEQILYDKNIKNTNYLNSNYNFNISNELEKSYSQFSEIFSSVASISEKRGINLFVLIMPSKYYLSTFNKNFKTPNYLGYDFERDLAKNQISDLLISAGISKRNIFDISEIVEFKDGGWKNYYFQNDAHLNQRGNALVADYILSRVVK